MPVVPRLAPLVAAAVVALAPVACGSSSPGPPPSSAAGERGAELVAELGCQSCHSIDGSRRVGPTWQGLAGSPVTLSDGTTVVADRAYLTRAIAAPAEEVVDGFSPIMPDLSLDPEAIAAIVTYIEELP